jgi:hypothetical protein
MAVVMSVNSTMVRFIETRILTLRIIKLRAIVAAELNGIIAGFKEASWRGTTSWACDSGIALFRKWEISEEQAAGSIFTEV